MKILLVNYRYFISGGPERYMFNVKQLLEEHGHEVIPFSIRSSRNVESEYSKYFVDPIGKEDAVYFDEVKKTPRTIMQLLARSIYSPSVKRAIEKEIADVKPDIVYIIHFVNKLSPSAITGAKKMGVPVVLRLSDFFLICPRFDMMLDKKPCRKCLDFGYVSCIRHRCVKNSLFASMIRVLAMIIHEKISIYDNVSAFVAPSRFLEKTMIEKGFPSNKMYNIPTFVICDDKKSDVIGTYGLYFGRIAEEKGVETAILAYEKLPEKQLKIVGDDSTDECKRLKEYISRKGIKNIEFLGAKSGRELENAIVGARYVLIPSIWFDNLPNTALEAFSHHKPIIASNIGSLPEIVDDGVNGYLFEPKSVEDLIRKIELLDRDEEVVNFGTNGYNKAQTIYDSERHYKTLIELFESVIKKNKGIIQ